MVKNIGVDDGKARFSLAAKFINGGYRRSPELPNISYHANVLFNIRPFPHIFSSLWAGQEPDLLPASGRQKYAEISIFAAGRDLATDGGDYAYCGICQGNDRNVLTYNG